MTLFSIIRIFQSLRSEDTFYNISSLRTDTPDSLSVNTHGRNTSDVDLTHNAGVVSTELEERDESTDEPTPKRKKLDYEDTKIEITVAQLQEMELRGTVLRPIYSEKLSELRRVKLEKMFDIQNASLTTIIVSKTDTNMSQGIVLEGSHRLSTVQDLDCKSTGYSNFRIPVHMFEVEDGVFSTAWPHCLPLKFSETFKTQKSVSSRVNLDLIPSVILDIGMEIHSKEQFRTKGQYSSNDSDIFIFKYLKNTINDTELEKLRNHPHARGEFWNKLEDRGLVLAAGSSKVAMVPLYVFLMKPLTQKISLKKLEADKFPTAHRIFINLMTASLKDDTATAELLSGYTSSKMRVIKLQTELAKISGQENVRLTDNENEDKSEESDFVVLDTIDDIEDSSICFFYETIPTDDVQQMISKKLNLVVAEPSGATIKEIAKWPADQITSTTLNSLVYNGHGAVRFCCLSGERLLPKGSRHLAPVSSRKLSNFVSKWFPGQTDGKIHTVRGFFTIPEGTEF
ncbi:hypothetical protein GCK72_017698 [Caenorhabditis remanei]|uniref:Uncharacterized protein n=1 Tax=Caenorhabditis remanei TaxID=31234 RepID=A0A6A5G971_CAERE|nr:hypothetical protein GCK72_017698 [Caenorhabditis remanei]KAF1751144.1 hypothetical protein GCK72_017698 [Caenorhabditis remanei]